MIQKSHFWVISKAEENRISKRYMQPHVHCSIIHSNPDMATTKCFDQQRSGTEYYSMWEKKHLAFGTTWMNLEGIMVYEINQTQKDSTAWYHLCGIWTTDKNSKPSQTHRNRDRKVVARHWRKQEKVVKRVQMFIYKMSEVWGSRV